MQDTLERAWSKLHLYRRGTDLRAWLFTVMHNVHVNQLRASRPTAPLDDEMPELAQPARRPTRWCCATWMRAIRRLPPDQREVLLLVALEDMSYEETAGALGDPDRHRDVEAGAGARETARDALGTAAPERQAS